MNIKAVEEAYNSTEIGRPKVVDGEFHLNYKPKELKPVSEALKPQRRFKHLTDVEVIQYQKTASSRWDELLKLDWKPLPF